MLFTTLPVPPVCPPALQAIRDFVQSKTGKAPIMSWVFPKQEAVAVLMPDMESAVAAL